MRTCHHMYAPEQLERLIRTGLRAIYMANAHISPLDKHTRQFFIASAAAALAIGNTALYDQCINLLAGRKVPTDATLVFHAEIDRLLATVVNDCYFEMSDYTLPASESPITTRRSFWALLGRKDAS